jgi:hypothetical protein
MTADAVLAEADELYALPLADFTPARDARAKALKPEAPELAARVKALRKPSIGAWVVNLLVRREADQVDQVLTVGAALREAAANLDGAELRELTRQRRQVTSAVTSRARGLAADEGHRVTEAVAEQVEQTLTAAMLDEAAARAVRSGLLVATMRATGVDAVDVAAALAVPEAAGFAATPRSAPVPEPPQLHAVPDPEPDEAAREEARQEAAQAVADAAAGLTDATARRDQALAAVDGLRAASLQLQSEIDELRRRLVELESRAEANDDALTEAQDDLDAAEDAVDEAHRAHDQAVEALDALS